MDAIRNLPEFILEFVVRRDFIGVYLSALGAWCLWLGLSGLVRGSTRGFGWQRGTVSAHEAALAGRAWVVIAAGLLAVGFVLWFTA